MITTLRGRASDATKSSAAYDGTKEPSSPWSSISERVLASVRLCTATVWPWRAKFRARFRPMVASPVTPMSAPLVAMPTSGSLDVPRCEANDVAEPIDRSVGVES